MSEESKPTIPANLPPWAKQGLGWALAFALAFIASRWGIQPAPIPQPTAPVVVVMGQPGAAMPVPVSSTGK